MTKYKVSELVMKELKSTRLDAINNYLPIYTMLYEIPANSTLGNWTYEATYTIYGIRAREKAVIDYVFNGADNFEVKKPTWVIVSKKASKDGYYISLTKANFVDNLKAWSWGFYESRSKSLDGATRITDPKLKDALLYANKGFEAIEVEI